MGATLIANDLKLALVLHATHFQTLEGWKAELAKQRKENLEVWWFDLHVELNPGHL